MITVKVKDAEGAGHELGITPEHAAKVTIVGTSGSNVSTDDLTRFKQLRAFFVNDSDSSDLNVNGSSTAQHFYIRSELGKIKWITGVRFVFNSVNMELNTNDFRRFGAAAIAPGLTNGILFDVHQSGEVTNFFIEPVKMIGDFFNYCDEYNNFINAIDNQTDFASFLIKFDQPIALPVGVEDHMHITIRDDLSAITYFKVIARGYQELV